MTLSRRLKDSEEGFDRLEEEAEKVGLRGNHAKTHYLFAQKKIVGLETNRSFLMELIMRRATIFNIWE